MPGINIRTLQAMAETGDRQATSILARFERRYAQLVSERLQNEAAMHHAPSNEGRAAIAVRVADTVNGTETRVSERWTASERKRQPVRSIHVSSRRWRERGTEAAVAAALGGGRAWREWHAWNEHEARAASGQRETAAQRERREYEARLAAIVARVDHGATAERLA